MVDSKIQLKFSKPRYSHDHHHQIYNRMLHTCQASKDQTRSLNTQFIFTDKRQHLCEVHFIQKDKVSAHGKYFNTGCLTSDIICNWRQTLKQFELPLKCFISNHIFPRKGMLVLKTSFIPAFGFENVLAHWQSGQVSFSKFFSSIWLLFVGPCLASSLNALDIFAFAFCLCCCLYICLLYFSLSLSVSSPSVFVFAFVFAFCHSYLFMTCYATSGLLGTCIHLTYLSLSRIWNSDLFICLNEMLRNIWPP